MPKPDSRFAPLNEAIAEVEAVLSRRGLGGLIVVTSPEAMRYEFIPPYWMCVSRHAQKLSLELDWTSSAAIVRTRTTLHVLEQLSLKIDQIGAYWHDFLKTVQQSLTYDPQ